MELYGISYAELERIPVLARRVRKHHTQLIDLVNVFDVKYSLIFVKD